MIYQIRTFNPLCTSKAYYNNEGALRKHVADVISATNFMRLELDPIESMRLNWLNPVNRMDIENGLTVTTIDEEQLPDWQNYFGKEQDIGDPVVKIENGIKHYPKRRESSCASA
jgi:hypothetical protein